MKNIKNRMYRIRQRIDVVEAKIVYKDRNLQRDTVNIVGILPFSDVLILYLLIFAQQIYHKKGKVVCHQM